MLSLLTSPDEVLQTALGKDSVVKMCPSLSVWETKAPSLLQWKASEKYRQGKKDLLGMFLSEFPGCCLDYDENPIEDALPGRWENVGGYRWIVPKDVKIDNLYEWLYLGNWLLFKSVAPHSQNDLTGLVARKAKDVLDIMMANSIVACLSSFHDNDPWTIAFAEGVMK